MRILLSMQVNIEWHLIPSSREIWREMARSDLIYCDLNSGGVSTARRDTTANVNYKAK